MPRILTKEVATVGTGGSLVTTTEGVVVTSPLVRTFPETCRVHIRAYAVVSSGVGTTGITPRIRRGTLISDPLVGIANTEPLKTAAANIEPWTFETSEEFQGRADVQYVFTLQQVGATGNGSIAQATIEVEVIGG